MKIGIISREYPPDTHIGGIGTYSHMAATLLAENGHEVHVFCNGLQTHKSMQEGITVHRIAMQAQKFWKSRIWYLYRKWFRKNFPHFLEAITWARSVGDYLKTCAEWKILEVLEYPETNGEGALLPPIPKNLNVVCRIHSSWLKIYTTGNWEQKKLLRLQRKSCAKAHRIVSPSQYMIEHYAYSILGLKQKVTLNRNPLRLWQEKPPLENKTTQHLLFVGRVEYRKGLDILLEALDQLGDAAKDLTLRVVGAMHPHQEIRDDQCIEIFRQHLNLSQNKKLPYTLEYFPAVPQSQLREHYDWAGLLILPSRMDNFPYVGLEGLSRGCYLIASDVGGLPELLLHNNFGKIFLTKNSLLLGQIIRQCREHEREILSGMANAVQGMESAFSAKACYQRLLEAYDKKVGEKDNTTLPLD